MSGTSVVVGLSAKLSRFILDEDIGTFARLALDENPVHFDDELARRALFQGHIAHGLLGAALISGCLTKLMGAGNLWLKASISFEKPIYPGDELQAILTVTEVSRRGVATIAVRIENQRKECVIHGEVQSVNPHRDPSFNPASL